MEPMARLEARKDGSNLSASAATAGASGMTFGPLLRVIAAPTAASGK